MRKHIKYIICFTILLGVFSSYAQKREQDTLNTGVIDVVKPYVPSISDAFKVKESPALEPEASASKKDVEYNIFSFPVASTFQPEKGKAAGVEIHKPAKMYSNYGKRALGSYTTVLSEAFLTHKIGENQNISAFINYLSSSGGIEDLVLPDNYTDCDAQLNYASHFRNVSWYVDGGFQYQSFNWYGLPETQLYQQDFLDALDVKHDFYNVYLGSDVKFKDANVKSASFFFKRFTDNLGSGENHFIADADFDVHLSEKLVTTNAKIAYLGGAFDRAYQIDEELAYGNVVVEASPSYRVKQGNLTFDLGASLVFYNDIEAGSSKLFTYPQIALNYDIVKNVVIFFGGIKGGLNQNTYQEFSAENAFVSPTLNIAPTNQKYNTYVGLKGKLSNSVSYSLDAGYKNEAGKALFVNNARVIDFANARAYELGNSFGLVYDDVNTLNIAGELKADISNKFKLALKTEFFQYKTSNQIEAWNLPDIISSLYMDYKPNERLYAGVNLFYMGERKDLVRTSDSLEFSSDKTVSLDDFIDINAHIGYNITKKISVFTKANNILNKGYERWLNTPVQRFQILAGVTFKFDF